jgi:hypothetical protein
MILRRMCYLCLVWAASLLLNACAGGSAHMVDSWKDPSAGPVEFKKVAVFFLNEDQTVRGIGEEELVRQVKRTVAVPSIALFPQLDPKDVDRIVDQLKSRSFDGAVLMHIVNVDEKVTVSPGVRPAFYMSFSAYFDYVVPTLAYYPGLPSEERKDRKVKVETVVYSLAESKLLWIGISETDNPETIRDLVVKNAAVVAGSLRQSGLLK